MTKTFPSPDELWHLVWHKIPAYAKWTFFSTIIVGLIAHTYMFTNKFPNHDDIYALFDASYGVQSGRWFLATVLSWDGQLSMPWIIGVLGLFFLGLTAALTANLFHIYKPIPCFLTGALIASAPMVCATYAYMFTADGYFFAAFLVSVGVFLLIRFHTVGFLLSIFFICLATGIYQAYFPLAVVLILGALLMDILVSKRPFKYYFFKSFTTLIALVLSLVSYFVIMKFTTRNQPLTEYMGLNSMGQVELGKLPQLIQNAYQAFFSCFFENKLGLSFEWLHYFLTASLGASFILILILFWQKKLSPLKIFLALLYLVLYPLAGNLIYVMSGLTDPHLLMLIPSIYFFILPVAVASQASELLVQDKNFKRISQVILVWIITLTMLLTVYSNIITDNKAYFRMNLAQEQIKAYSTRLIADIVKNPDYTPDIEVYFIGSRIRDEKLRVDSELQDFNISGVPSFADMRTSYSYGLYLNRFMAFPNKTFAVATEEKKKVTKDPYVLAMPRYPDPKSIQKVGDYLVVKFN